MEGRKDRKSYLFLIMEEKRKILSLETKYDILWEIGKGSKTKTEIAKDFQIQKSTLTAIMCKNEINDWFFLIKCFSKWQRMVNNQFVISLRYETSWYKELIRYMLTRNSGFWMSLWVCYKRSVNCNVEYLNHLHFICMWNFTFGR
jgi:hypothetical protein